jgi:hypothetical protein
MSFGVVTALFLEAIFSCTLIHSQTVNILFDATKAETASSADWVIDADLHNLGWNPNAQIGGGNESNAQQLPTPAQSGVTSSTAETYWTGALSGWGIDCVKRGYHVETLPYNGQITYGNSGNAQDLSQYKVFIVCEPNIVFTTAEKTALMNFIQNGGGLFMVSDHTVSDRNNDGWDSPAIWNDFITNNSVQNNAFGMNFDLQNFSETTTNIPNLPNDSILHGPMGNVTQALWANGTSLTLDPAQNSSVKGVIYKTGSTFGNTNVMCAYARYGSGKIAAIGDSSPCDDGTGDPNDVLYNGYYADASGNHELLLMNITIWLATSNAANGIFNLDEENSEINIFPNPSEGKFQVLSSKSQVSRIEIYNLLGLKIGVMSPSGGGAGGGFSLDVSDAPNGIYFLKIKTEKEVFVKKIVIR